MVDEFTWLRNQAKDKRSKELINEIENDKKLVEKKGKIIKSNKIFSIKLGNFIIWLRKKEASSVIDIYFEIFGKKYYTILPEFLGEKDKVVLDIGANEGYYVLKMKENNPNLKIIAVEPNPYAFEILQKNIKTNKIKNITLVNNAISTKNARIKFQIVDEISTIGAIKIIKKPWLDAKRIRNIIVSGISLSKLCKINNIKNIDILKIDTEGSELDVLKSSSDSLKNVRKIVIEYHSNNLKDSCIKFLTSRGFMLLKEIRCGKRGYIYFMK